MSDVIEFTDVTLVRAGHRLLDGVSWSVADGQRWVILGPNGAGKTTLLQIAATNMHPTSGRAVVLGETLGAVDVFELRPLIGLTSAALAERIPARERVLDVVRTAAYGVLGRWRESYEDVDDSRAYQLLDRLEIPHLAERTFGTLSEGERKRAQIARAMMSDPELLLLDEPTAGLDLGGRETLVATVGEIASDPSSPALVLVTHHVEEIPRGITHALLLREGGVVAAGPIETTLTSDNVSSCFGLPLHIGHDNGRWNARAI
ncbi:ABC transporter ATP-binding protein [Actinobacteria bacterium YIM 96077]|uniref:ABC transporter ATP-binding protein n=1 Tax=Phytoactinopolyspora halophila TaxID=1981511 RepID=A0A329QLM5_9ACTN|nr:ABC transporter ATP-binding protein [Phytoactinopolyspora halophila]AYY12980.1 ABC transporter ATP-binding protein [Actinobacteria bacterium YIM 96077]RAW13244.1 ABC transporter ATP-binding protein [Phytoactinopolyspora halophila]